MFRFVLRLVFMVIFTRSVKIDYRAFYVVTIVLCRLSSADSFRAVLYSYLFVEAVTP